MSSNSSTDIFVNLLKASTEGMPQLRFLKSLELVNAVFAQSYCGPSALNMAIRPVTLERECRVSAESRAHYTLKYKKQAHVCELVLSQGSYKVVSTCGLGTGLCSTGAVHNSTID